jgi:hypothetical protein
VKYPSVFDDEIGCLPGEYNIHLDETVKPVVHPPRAVPVALREQVKLELDRLEKANVIAKVTEPTPWVSSLVVVKKKNDAVRLCIDPSDLNRAIKREHFPMPSVDDVATRLHGSTVFSTLDATSGYFQMKLTKESSMLLVFNTPFGRYRYLRMPMGVKCAPEIFQREMTEFFADLPGVEVVMDDLLVHGKDLKQHNERLNRVLQRAQKLNLKLNPEKCNIGLPEVNYVGHRLTSDGLQPTSERISAITNMKTPGNLQELESFLGMVAYVAKFIPNLSQRAAPLRELKRNEWEWTHRQDKAFRDIQHELSREPLLRYYSTKDPVTLTVDASKKGLGCALIQNNGVVAYASRTLTSAEENYAQIEKETLAVVFACTKFHKLIYGRNVTIESDHKPLENIMKKPLHAAPMRIQRMLLKLQPYSINLIHVKGKELGLADCLSRLPVERGTQLLDDELMVCKTETLAHKWQQKIEEATKGDQDLNDLKRIIFDGWPTDKQNLPSSVLPYWNMRDELSSYHGVIYKGERIVIPTSLRSEILKILHRSHTGIVKTKQRARDMVYWPGLNSQIEDMTNNCEACLKNRPRSQKEPMTIHPVPTLPWNKVGADLFEFEKVHYLLLVDYFSNYIEVMPLQQDTRSCAVIKQFKINIARYGLMETLLTDNGPQFSSKEFSDFVNLYGISHITSSPTHQQSNGLAEEAVKQIKSLMTKCKDSGDDFFLALLDLRNTPRDSEIGSPMQRLHGRRAQTSLPMADSLLQPATLKQDRIHDKLMEYRQKQKFYFDKGSKPLTAITGDKAVRVWTPQGWKIAEYMGPHHLPNSHMIRTQNGVYRRNRKHLMMTKEQPYRVPNPEPRPSTLPPLVLERRPERPFSQTVPPDVASPPVPKQTTTPNVPPTAPSLSRPVRDRKKPGWTKDYVMK